MRERTPQSMLRWISRHYNMSTADLARMFQRNQRTIHSWMREGRISVKNSTRIRTSFYFLTGVHDPRDSGRSPIEMM